MGCNNCQCVKKQEGAEQLQFETYPSNLQTDFALLEARNKNLFRDNSQPKEENYNSEILKSLTIGNQNTNIKDTINNKEIPEKNESENESISSNFLSVNQDRNETLFDYFNEIRLNPQTFEKEAESHGLLEFIQNIKESTEAVKALIKNPYYNLALESYIMPNKSKGNIDDESELIKEIENDTKLMDFDKELYIVEANSENATEAVWNLLEENKHRNKTHLLTDKIDILVVASMPIRGTQNFKAYFLFLKSKK